MADAVGAEAGEVGKPQPEEEASTDEEDGEDSEADDTGFNYGALEEAQRLATIIDERAGEAGPSASQGAAAPNPKKRKQRGGCKEAKKRRKRQRFEEDIRRAREVGMPLPFLREGSKPSTTAPAAPSQSPAAKPSACSEQASTNEDLPRAHDSRTAAAIARVTKEGKRRAKIAEAQQARTLFITNLSFKITEQEIHDWLDKCGRILQIRLPKDKATNHQLGYGHVEFDSPAAVATAVRSCDKFEFRDRVMRVASVKQGERVAFELPETLREDVRSLLREGYEGYNLSAVKDAWQKRHPGQKFNTEKFGFKNFSTAIETIEGVCLERHLEKKLTHIAFIKSSPAHVAFLEKKRLQEQADREKKEEAKAHAEAGAPAAGGQAAPPRRRLRGKQPAPGW